MGLGLRTSYLHDAILQYGGLASTARLRFTQLPYQEQQALIRYLRTF